MPEPLVSAVMLAYNRAATVEVVLDRLEELDEVDEVVVVDNGSDGTAEIVNSRPGKARAVRAGGNVGLAGRNVGAREAKGRYLLMLDDDSVPLPGAVDALVRAIEHGRTGIVGGLVRNIDPEGNIAIDHQVGSFDWWLRAGRMGDPPPEGWPAFFFAEGGALMRRDAYLEVGGFFEPYFFANSELDLATRMVGAGWEVRYLPAAVFDHLREETGRPAFSPVALEHRVRNLIWYFALRFPAGLAARRIPAYLAFDLMQAVLNREVGAWWRGVRGAWTERAAVRGERRPLPREVLRRAELNRGRRHLALLADHLRRRMPFLREPPATAR